MTNAFIRTLQAALLWAAAGCGGATAEDVCLSACRRSVACYGGAFADCVTSYQCARLEMPQKCKMLPEYTQCINACVNEAPCSDYSRCVLNCPDPQC